MTADTTTEPTGPCFGPAEPLDDPGPQDDDPGGCRCRDLDGPFRLEIDEGSVFVTHEACGMQPPGDTWVDLLTMGPIGVVASWTKNHAGRNHVTDGCDCNDLLVITPVRPEDQVAVEQVARMRELVKLLLVRRDPMEGRALADIMTSWLDAVTSGPDPWQRALDGLNSLVDAGIEHTIVGDDRINALDGGTAIVWDYDLDRWRLVIQPGRVTAPAATVTR